MKPRRIRGVLVLSAIILLIFVLTFQVRALLLVPTHLRLLPGQEHRLTVGFPLTLVDSNSEAVFVREGNTVRICSDGVGKYNLEVRLLGLLPIRSVVVDVVRAQEVVPGGEAIGVLLASRGLLVSKIVSIQGADGRSYFPTRDAGIRVGDVLVSVNGQEISSSDQVSRLLDQLGPSGRPIPVEVKRKGRTLRLRLRPAKVISDRGGYRYMMGAILEPPTAGVGTLTFFDPDTRLYGAVGHIITNNGTGEPLAVEDGRIVRAYISGIRQGSRGRPGEKHGIFQSERDVIGTITKNTPFGIYGQLTQNWKPGRRPVPVALASQVQVGPATILTVLDGQEIEEFSVEIEKVNRQSRPNGKGLVLSVTDPVLLQRTGGIVQGMSGSPILQNGRLVGAVTHVFMNDPRRGFGVLAEWMVYEAGLAQTRAQAGFQRDLRVPAALSPI